MPRGFFHDFLRYQVELSVHQPFFLPFHLFDGARFLQLAKAFSRPVVLSTDAPGLLAVESWLGPPRCHRHHGIPCSQVQGDHGLAFPGVLDPCFLLDGHVEEEFSRAGLRDPRGADLPLLEPERAVGKCNLDATTNVLDGDSRPVGCQLVVGLANVHQVETDHERVFPAGLDAPVKVLALLPRCRMDRGVLVTVEECLEVAVFLLEKGPFTPGQTNDLALDDLDDQLAGRHDVFLPVHCLQDLHALHREDPAPPTCPSMNHCQEDFINMQLVEH